MVQQRNLERHRRALRLNAERTALAVQRAEGHAELVTAGGRLVYHRNWSENAKRPQDVPFKVYTHHHRCRPPLCCGCAITRPVTEADHSWDGISILRTLTGPDDPRE